MFRILTELLIAIIMGIVVAEVSMYAALTIAPIDKGPWYITIAFATLFIGGGLWYLRRRWGIGAYDSPNDKIITTSTIEKAFQADRLRRWTEGSNNETW